MDFLLSLSLNFKATTSTNENNKFNKANKDINLLFDLKKQNLINPIYITVVLLKFRFSKITRLHLVFIFK